MSHDLLDDLLADVPRQITPDAAAAWRAGTGRRRRTHVVEGLAVAAAVALVGLGLVQLHDHTPVQPVDGKTGKVDGYPSEVGWPWGRPELPQRPGPMAGVIVWSDDSSTGAAVVSSSGESWELPNPTGTFTPALSDDGRWLAFLQAEGEGDSTFVLRDLVTGDQKEFPQLGSNIGANVEPYLLLDSPAFWSPDNDAIVVRAARRSGPGVRQLLLTTDGALKELNRADRLAGWLDTDRIVWWRSSGAVTFTDRNGEVVDHLQLTSPEDNDAASHFGVRVSPDATELALLDIGVDSGVLSTYSLVSGEVVNTAEAATTTNTTNGPPVWRGDDLLTPSNAGLADAASGDTVVSFAGRWPAVIATQWAADAFTGPDRGGPSVWEWRYWQVWWWWKQLVVGTLVVGAGLGVWWFHRRDRRKLAPRT